MSRAPRPPLRHVALLRAINVGGHVVKMDRLRALFEELGFGDVKTLIASGNVVFHGGRAAADALERRIERHLEQALGYPVATFVRSTADLASVVAHDPFDGAETVGTLYLGFLKSPLDRAGAQRLAALQNEVDRLHARGRELYWHCRTRISESPIGMAKLERAIGGPTTFRNVSTVRKLAAMHASGA
jgi:uncharacterized protein (DUF1697 family)